MRILYVSECAGSRIHGPAYRKYQFAREFVKRGHEVMIAAASFSHVRKLNTDMGGMKLKDELIDGIRYKWLKTPQYSGNGLSRIRQDITFNLRLFFNRNKITKEFKPDIVIVSSVMPTDFYFAHKVAKKAGARIIFEVGDLWPLTPTELGGYSKRHPFIMALQVAENYAYKHTDAVVTLLPCAEEYMKSHGLSDGKFHFIPNGVIPTDWKVETDLPEPHKTTVDNLRKEGKFLVGYAGTMSISNALFTLLDVAKKLNDTDIHFVLIGSGPIKEEMEAYVQEHNLKNVTFLPSILKSHIPGFMSTMDALYTGFLKRDLYRFGISPNKIYDYMMAGKPIIQAIKAGNNLVELADCGIYAEPENPEAIAGAIVKLKNMPKEELERLGANGKKYVLENHSYDILVDRFLEVMNKLMHN